MHPWITALEEDEEADFMMWKMRLSALLEQQCRPFPHAHDTMQWFSYVDWLGAPSIRWPLRVPEIFCIFFCCLKRIREVGLAASAPVVSVTDLPAGAPRVQQDPATLQAYSQQVAAERRPSWMGKLVWRLIQLDSLAHVFKIKALQTYWASGAVCVYCNTYFLKLVNITKHLQ